MAGHTLRLDGASLTVDPAAGGRVTSLRLGDVELLSGREADPDNYGSTFWTSPQSDWGWPPPAAIDRAGYAATRAPDAEQIALAGEADPRLGLRVCKRFAVDPTRGAFVLSYEIVNAGAAPRTCAPWQVTRVRPGGLTFFPAGAPARGSLGLEERGGVAWYAHDAAALPAEGRKAFGGGSGGLVAHAAGGVLLVKAFEPVAAERQAPGESAIEVYACPRYVEVEAQGAYAPIASGASATWSITWFVRAVPRGIEVAAGSAGLLVWARQIAAEGRQARSL